MSTPNTAPAVDRDRTFDVSGTSRVPFGRLVQVELRKMYDTRAGFWLLALTGLIIVVAIGAVAWQTRDGGTEFENYLASTTMPLQFLLPILGILVVTGEWTQRTTLTTFALEPSRLRVMGAKLVSALVFAVAAMLLAGVVAAVVTLALGSDDAWGTFESDMFVNMVVLLVIGMLQGVAFGTLLLSSAGAIVAFFAVPIVFTIVTGFLPESARRHSEWYDISEAQIPLFEGGYPDGSQWAALAVAVLLWIGLPLVLGLFRVQRMELK